MTVQFSRTVSKPIIKLVAIVCLFVALSLIAVLITSSATSYAKAKMMPVSTVCGYKDGIITIGGLVVYQYKPRLLDDGSVSFGFRDPLNKGMLYVASLNQSDQTFSNISDCKLPPAYLDIVSEWSMDEAKYDGQPLRDILPYEDEFLIVTGLGVFIDGRCILTIADIDKRCDFIGQAKIIDDYAIFACRMPNPNIPEEEQGTGNSFKVIYIFRIGKDNDDAIQLQPVTMIEIAEEETYDLAPQLYCGRIGAHIEVQTSQVVFDDSSEVDLVSNTFILADDTFSHVRRDVVAIEPKNLVIPPYASGIDVDILSGDISGVEYDNGLLHVLAFWATRYGEHVLIFHRGTTLLDYNLETEIATLIPREKYAIYKLPEWDEQIMSFNYNQSKVARNGHMLAVLDLCRYMGYYGQDYSDVYPVNMSVGFVNLEDWFGSAH